VVLEKRHGLKISCPVEIAFRLGYIEAVKLGNLAATLGKSKYVLYFMMSWLCRLAFNPGNSCVDHHRQVPMLLPGYRRE
jgi:hypothetical protein